MEILAKFKDLVQLLTDYQTVYSQAKGGLVIQLKTQSEFAQVVERLNEFDYEESLANLQIVLFSHQKNHDLVLYGNKGDFESAMDVNDLRKNVVLLSVESNGFIFWDGKSKNTYENDIIATDNFYFQNLIAYFNFLDFLKGQDKDDEKVFHFVDHFNELSKQIIFTSPKKEGKLVIPYKNFIPQYSPNVALQEIFVEFEDAFKDFNRHLPKFIKAQLFEVLPKVDRALRMKFLIEKLPEIINSAMQNFEIYLNDLSLENLKKEYLEAKDKIFIQYRDILSKVTNQIISFPIAVSASAFATYKIIDPKDWSVAMGLLLLIFIAFFSFSIFNVFVLKIQRSDVIELESTFKMDYDLIKHSPFFIKYPDEIVKFENIKVVIEKKFKLLTFIIDIYYWASGIVNLLFIGFILWQVMIISKWIVVLIVLLLFALLLLAYLYFHP